jgi:hypothetical protein
MVSAYPLATRVSMRNMEVVDDVCRSTFGCGGLDVATIALITATAVLAVLMFAAVVHVWDAEVLLDEEMKRLAAERDAFSKFAKRVSDIEAVETSTAVPASGGMVTTTSAVPDERMGRVADAYRETVMDVEHFDADYGEPIAENLAAEFGESIALAVVDGGQFTQQLKAAPLQSSREASRQREAFTSTPEAEAEPLEHAASTLAVVDDERESLAEAAPASRSYEQLVDDWHRLGELSERCRSIASERQERLRELSASMPPGEQDLHEYIYEELPVSHPVLADAASLSGAIDELRGRVLRSLTRRV